MDEGTANETQKYSSNRNDFKKDFIEKWLVDLSFEYKQRNDKQDFDSNPTGSFDSETASTSQLDWEEDGDSEFRDKKKASKLQFFNTLKNIFKKKKGEFGSDELVGGTPTASTFNILSMGAVGQDTTEVKENIIADPPVNHKSLTSNLNSYCESKRDGGTQTILQDSVVRIGAPGASIKNLDTLDQFNRGFSEIIHSTNYFLENNSENLSDVVGMNLVTSEPRCVPVDREPIQLEHEIVYTPEPKTIGDGWALEPSESCLSTNIPKNSYFHRPSNFNNQLSVNPVDSYVNKLELIKKFFGTRSTKADAPRPKPSLIVVKPLTNKSSSITVSVTDSCALTKDLTEAPYLREHERLQWQGKNRELWFRINALYHKYNRQRDNEHKPAPTHINPLQRTSSPQDVNPALEKIYYHTKGLDNRSESYFQYSRGKTESDRPRRNRILPFGKSEVKRHVKLEEIFVTEHIRNHRGGRNLSSSPGSLSRCLNQGGDYYKPSKKAKAQGWHCALEQVRASMQKMSEDDIEMVRSATASRDYQRCQSKISVALSGSDWEEETPSLESKPSVQSIKRQRRLPNIPYTPSFRHHFRTKF